MKKLFIIFLCGLLATGTAFSQTGVDGPIKWEIADGVLTITGEGDMPEYDAYHPAPWSEQFDVVTSIEFEHGVTSISKAAFRDFYNVTSVSLSETVATIGTNAFSFCSKLPSITIPASVIFIDEGVFGGCSAMTSILVDLSNPEYSSDDGVLFNKDKTTLVSFPPAKSTHYTIPEGVTSIGNGAFTMNNNLTSVTISTSMISIGNTAFYRTGITSIAIPASVTSIGELAFAGCGNMTSISVVAGNDYYSSEEGVLFNDDMTTLVVFPSGITGNYVIPESVETIGFGAFWESKLSSVIFPTSLISIGVHSFRLCGNLTSIIIPSSVKTINSFAFLACYNLTFVIIPASVTTIGDGVFYDCPKLSQIVNASQTPQVLSQAHDGVFSDVIYNTCTLWVPAASVNAYKTATVWKEFKNIFAGITFDKEELYMLPGAEETIVATIHTDLITINNSISVWSIYKSSVVTTNNHTHTAVTVTAVSPGLAHISLFIGGIMEAICVVTVIEEGSSSIEGTVYYEGTEDVTVNLYMEWPEDMEQSSLTKAKVVGGYVLLAKTVPKSNGQYSFENLPAGTYLVDVEIHGYESELSREIKISMEEIRSDINFTVNSDTHVITIELTTGADELSDAGLNIYPNPFYGLLHIEGAEGSTVRIFSVDGKPLHVQTVTGADETIQLERLSVGMYIIRLENGGRVKTIKVIKN